MPRASAQPLAAIDISNNVPYLHQELDALELEQPWRHLLITLPTHVMDGRVARPAIRSSFSRS